VILEQLEQCTGRIRRRHERFRPVLVLLVLDDTVPRVLQRRDDGVDGRDFQRDVV